MILYVSNVSAYDTYNRLTQEGKLVKGWGYQMQKFNDNIVQGLSAHEEVVAVSCLGYANIKAERIEERKGNITYIAVKNTKGKLHKLFNLLRLKRECRRIVKRERPTAIVCDAFSLAPCVVSKAVGRRKKIPTVAIVTDIPALSVHEQPSERVLKRMYGFDGYVLLTEQMNELINREGKPYMVMEGLCAKQLPQPQPEEEKKIILYTGSLWKKDAGIEYFTEGFLQAALPNTELHFYGSGELTPWIEALSQTHGQVQYKGLVANQEMVALQAKATLLVNPRPSDQEFCKYSFPSKTMEYMASGTPVLMTKLPGVPKEYFPFVYTVEEETAEGVCRALREIFATSASERERKGLQAREFVTTHKNNAAQTARLAQFLRQRIGTHKE